MLTHADQGECPGPQIDRWFKRQMRSERRAAMLAGAALMRSWMMHLNRAEKLKEEIFKEAKELESKGVYAGVSDA